MAVKDFYSSWKNEKVKLNHLNFFHGRENSLLFAPCHTHTHTCTSHSSKNKESGDDETGHILVESKQYVTNAFSFTLFCFSSMTCFSLRCSIRCHVYTRRNMSTPPLALYRMGRTSIKLLSPKLSQKADGARAVLCHWQFSNENLILNQGKANQGSRR